MTRRRAPRLALALIERFVPDSEALVGDVIEEFQTRRSRAWVWRQALGAVGAAWHERSVEIRPLRLVELQPADAVERSRQLVNRLPPVNLSASPLPDIGGLGLVLLGFLVTVVTPSAWWALGASVIGGVAVGVVMIVVRARTPAIGSSILALLLAATGPAAGQTDLPRGPVPVSAIDGILAAFETHAIVALPDAHGGDQAHAFLLELVRDPRLGRIVDDIVVEFGNARHQAMADRFVAGEQVPDDSLRLIWRDHTQPSISADFTHYAEFFQAVRSVNATSGARKLRVLLGDPPIDWRVIRNRADHFKWVEMRDAYPAAVIQTEVIAKQRRALVVYGTGHLQRRNVMSNFEMEDWRSQTIVSLLERAGPTRVFTIAGASAKQASGWQPPALAPTHGTTLGAADASEYFGPPRRFAMVNGKMVPVPEHQWRRLRAEEQFDAVLYLGPASQGQEPLSKTLCTEAGYLEMRLKRISLAGLPPAEGDRVRKLCGDEPR